VLRVEAGGLSRCLQTFKNITSQ